MFEMIKNITGEQLIEFLKTAGAALAVMAPVFKSLASSGKGNAHHLDERYSRLKAFFDAGGVEQHPFLIESAFGAAVGHTKLDAREIPLVLSQLRPTAFMNSYLRVRSYLAPDDHGRAFELKSIAAKPLVRKAFVVAGVLLYGLFLSVAAWMLLYLAPQQASKHNWGELAWSFALSGLFSALAVYCLFEASRPYWANNLYLRQVRIP